MAQRRCSDLDSDTATGAIDLPQRTTADDAQDYIDMGFALCPLVPASKEPKKRFKWSEYDADADDFKGDFAHQQYDIAVVLGERSGHLADLDFDCPEAALIASRLFFEELPSYGRGSMAGSHRFVTCPSLVHMSQFKLPKNAVETIGLHKEVVAEIRGGQRNALTRLPPSTHESGEQLQWERPILIGENLAEFEADELERQMGLVSFLAVVLKCYPLEGGRDDLCLALSGALLAIPWLDEAYAETIVTTLAELAGDEEAPTRSKVKNTAKRMAEDEPVAGFNRLIELLELEFCAHILARWLHLEERDQSFLGSNGIIIEPDQIDEMVAILEDRLLEADEEVFQLEESSEFVRIIRFESAEGEKQIRVTPLTKEVIVGEFGKYGPWISFNSKGEAVRKGVPKDLASYFIQPRRSKLRKLKGVVNNPTLRPDGSVIQREGYDEKSRLLVCFGESEFPKIPRRVTKKEGLESYRAIQARFTSFKLRQDRNDESVLMAMLLTPLVRSSLNSAPMFGIDAPTAGSGKSLLADLTSIMATGKAAPKQSFGASETELEKRVGAALLANHSFLVFDNINRPIKSDILCSLLTEEILEYRELGKSELHRSSTALTVIGTGNNLIVGGDMHRRILMLRIDQEVARPEQTVFTGDIYSDIKDARPELVVHGIKVLKGYLDAKRPLEGSRHGFGSFDDWNRFIREPIVWYGEQDPCAYVHENKEMDDAQEELADIIDAWYGSFGDQWLSVAELEKEFGPVHGANGQRKLLNSGDAKLNSRALRNLFTSMLQSDDWNSRRVGRYLTRHVGEIVDGRRLERSKNALGKHQFRVARMGPMIKEDAG